MLWLSIFCILQKLLPEKHWSKLWQMRFQSLVISSELNERKKASEEEGHFWSESAGQDSFKVISTLFAPIMTLLGLL